MKPETRKLWNEGKLKMTNPMERRCVDCEHPLCYAETEPCPRCAQYVCDKHFDGAEGMCLACPQRAQNLIPAA